MKSVLDSPNIIRDNNLSRHLNSGPRKLTTDEFRNSMRKIVPPQEAYQGYQRSGMLLFNNINNQDTNAFQNNQTFRNQTMNQIVPERSLNSLQKASNVYYSNPINSTTKAQSKKTDRKKGGGGAFNEAAMTRSQESFIS